MPIRADVQIGDGHFALHATQSKKFANIPRSRMPIHAIQTEKRVHQEQQTDLRERHCTPEGP